MKQFAGSHPVTFNEHFDLHHAIDEITYIYHSGAHRRSLRFGFKVSGLRMIVVGDSQNI